MGKPLNSSLFEPSVTNMGHMFALFIQEPSRSRCTALSPGRGPDRTAHCRDAGRAQAAGKDGRCSCRPGAAAGQPGLPPGAAGPAGGGCGRRAPPRAEHPRGAAAAPRLARSYPRPPSLGAALGAARRNRSGRASRPSQFSLANFGCRQRRTRGHPRSAPPRRRALRSAQPRAPPRPRRLNKVAIGGVEEANCPGGGSGSLGSGLSAVLPAAGPGCGAGGGRALRVSCVHPPPAPRALSVPPWEQALPTQGGDRRSCPAAAGSLTHHTSHRHTPHTPVRAPLAPALESVLVPAGCSDLKSKGKAQRLRRCSCRRWW